MRREGNPLREHNTEPDILLLVSQVFYQQEHSNNSYAKHITIIPITCLGYINHCEATMHVGHKIMFPYYFTIPAPIKKESTAKKVFSQIIFLFIIRRT